MLSTGPASPRDVEVAGRTGGTVGGTAADDTGRPGAAPLSGAGRQGSAAHLSSSCQSLAHRARAVRVERLCVSCRRYHHVLPLRQPPHARTVLRARGLPTRALRSAAWGKASPGTYLPFGAGPRTCLGAPFAMMELKTVLAMLVQRFRLDVIPDQRVEATVRTTLQPKYGLRMRPHIQDGHTERSPARGLGNVIGASLAR